MPAAFLFLIKVSRKVCVLTLIGQIKKNEQSYNVKIHIITNSNWKEAKFIICCAWSVSMLRLRWTLNQTIRITDLCYQELD